MGCSSASASSPQLHKTGTILLLTVVCSCCCYGENTSNSEETSTIPVIVLPPPSDLQVYYNQSCSKDADCGSSTTFLKCSGRVCRCSINNYYEESLGQCLIRTGISCHKPEPAGGSSGLIKTPGATQPCVLHAICQGHPADWKGTCKCKRGGGVKEDDFQQICIKEPERGGFFSSSSELLLPGQIVWTVLIVIMIRLS